MGHLSKIDWMTSDQQGGTAAACLGLHCVLWCTCIKKTEINLGWPCFQEIGNMCDMENITYVSWKKYQEKKQV
jgi:hypothetical protein